MTLNLAYPFCGPVQNCAGPSREKSELERNREKTRELQEAANFLKSKKKAKTHNPVSSSGAPPYSWPLGTYQAESCLTVLLLISYASRISIPFIEPSTIKLCLSNDIRFSMKMSKKTMPKSEVFSKVHRLTRESQPCLTEPSHARFP